MNQRLNTQSIRQLLNRSCAHLDQTTMTQVRKIRDQALARYDTRSVAPGFVLAGAMSGTFQTTSPQKDTHFWVAALLVAIIMFGGNSYFKHLTEHDGSDVDIAILTDELPIDVYVD